MDRNKVKPRDGGFTVMELTVTMFILGMIVLTLGAMMAGSIRGWASGTDRARMDNAAAVASDKLWMDVRSGSSATVVTSTNQLSVMVPPFITDGNGEKYYNRAGAKTRYLYYSQNNNIYRQIGTNTPTLFARDVAIRSVGVSGANITITITSAASTRAGVKQQSLDVTSVLVMRNY